MFTCFKLPGVKRVHGAVIPALGVSFLPRQLLTLLICCSKVFLA